MSIETPRRERVADNIASSFQAPDFYQKFGHEVFGRVAGYPHGYQKVFLKKRLA